jgi:hypothetical protein
MKTRRTLWGIAIAALASVGIVACQTVPTSPDLDAADVTPPKRMVTQGT